MKIDQETFRNVGGFVVFFALVLGGTVSAQDDRYAEPDAPGLPPSNMELDISQTAIAITDPQIDFLTPDDYLAALIQFRFMANAVWTTSEAVARLSK